MALIVMQKGKLFEVLDPSTEKVITKVHEADEVDIDYAVDSARAAFDTGEWTKMEAHTRSNIIYAFAQLLKAHREELAQLESIDSGKPYDVALADDIDGTIQQFEYYAGFATKLVVKPLKFQMI